MAEKRIETSEAPARELPAWAEKIVRNRGKVLIAIIIGIPLSYYMFLYEPYELIASNYLREVCGIPDDIYPYSEYFYSEQTNEYVVRYSMVEKAFGSVFYTALNMSNWSQYACLNDSPVSINQYIDIISQEGDAEKEHYEEYLREIYARYGIETGTNNTSG